MSKPVATPQRSSEDEAIIHADKKLRRWMLILVIVLAAAGWLLLRLIHDYVSALEAIAENDLQGALTESIALAKVGAAFFVAGTLLVSGYFLWLGIRIFKADQYPLPGMRVIRDKKIVTGNRAKARAGVAVALAMVILIAGSLVILRGSRILSGLDQKTLKKKQRVDYPSLRMP